MLQSFALLNPGFIPTCVLNRAPSEGCFKADGVSSKTRVCGLRAPRFSGFHGCNVAHSWKVSTFTTIDRLEKNVIRNERRGNSGEHCFPIRRIIHASQKKRNGALTPSKRRLFLIDFRWIISAACKEVHPHISAEPRLLRKCGALLFSFLKTHTEKDPVAVVLPNQKELTHVMSRPNRRKRSKRKIAKVSLSEQFIPVLNKICRALGVSVYTDKLHGVRETIGRLTGSQREASILIVVVSSDRDFLQLLRRGQVTILKPDDDASFEEMTEELFTKAIHGLRPNQYADLFALIGKNDGRTGIPEIKREFAPLLISRFGSIEDLVAVAKDVLKAEQAPYKQESMKILSSESREFISPRIARILIRRERRLSAAKQLISITQDRNYRVKLTYLERRPANSSRITELLRSFDSYHRKYVSSDLTKTTPRVLNRQQRSVEKCEPLSTLSSISATISDKQDRTQAFSSNIAVAAPAIKAKPDAVTVDARTANDDLEVIIKEAGSILGILPVFELKHSEYILKGMACGTSNGKAVYVDLRSSQLPKVLVDALENKSTEKYGCYLRDLYKHLLRERNLSIGGILFDAHVALDLLGAGGKDIRRMVASYVDSSKSDLYQLLSDRSKSVLESSGKGMMSLCAALARMTVDLRAELEVKGLLPLALRVEFPLIRVLAYMEITGVPIVSSELKRLKTRYETKLVKIENEARDLLAARSVKSTTKKVSSEALFDACFGPQRSLRPPSKQFVKPPASRLELETMASDMSLPPDHRALADMFLQHEDISKFLERDVGPLFRHIQTDGRIRATFVQGDSVTGRLATRDPNLQTIPVRSQLGQELRSTFRTTPGMRMVCADYNQIELRIVASLCGDPFMLDAFSSGTDIHRGVAAKIFDVPITNVTNIQRNQAKQVIYSILYGVSSTGLSERLGVPSRDAENLLSEFRIEFPAVQELTTQLVNEASRAGYAKTLLGRRLPLPTLTRGNLTQRRAASRKAVNMPIQGTQADMIKLSMVRIHDRLRAIEATSSLVLQVHDELILEVADSELEEVISLVEEEMICALPLSGVDISVRVSCGPSWCKNG